MADLVCPSCGTHLEVRGSQITRVPGGPVKMHVDYECPQDGCDGSLRTVESQPA
jgi:hypothetical protein